MAFAVEISLAKARYNDSKIRVKSKGDLYNALTDRGTFIKILEQGEAELQESEICENMYAKIRNMLLNIS